MKYDLHIHSKYSVCSNLEPKTILKISAKKGLDGIAVTDHNTIKGALAVKKANKKKDFDVVVGAEIKTDKCELLGYRLHTEIKSAEFFSVLDEIKAQGGLAIVAHPFSLIGIARKRLSIDIKNIKKKIDGIECFNARNVFNFENEKAEEVAKKYNLCQTAGSDAHFWFEIGKAYTEFDDDLKKVIRLRKTKIYGSNSLAIPAKILTLFEKYLVKPFNHHFTFLIPR